ncbi:MAG: YebC/PmpR family DNA-binding transcriptional regulator [Patescibacteria group bacterium]
MSGHSKWANIKQRKGVQDAKKAVVFTKYAKMITVAAKDGGGDPDTNFRLKLAIDKAKQVNMPSDNIKRAVERGAGGGKDDLQIEEVVYEAYGPEGSAALITVFTDNKNRSLGELKGVFSKLGGSLGGMGTVNWMFEKKGVIEVKSESVKDIDEITLEAIDAGAEDVEPDEKIVYFYCQINDLMRLKEFLDSKGVVIESAGMVSLPKNTVKIEGEEKKEKVINWVQTLEDLDDVDKVETNVEL